MPLLWKWQLQPKRKWKCSSFYWQVLTKFSMWWLLSSSQTKPTHSCHIHQILLFSAFQCILFCLRLFKGFPSWIFFLFYLLFLSFQLVSLVGFLLLSFGFQRLVLVFIWKDQSLLTYHSLQEEVFLRLQLLFPLALYSKSVSVHVCCLLLWHMPLWPCW